LYNIKGEKFRYKGPSLILW